MAPYTEGGNDFSDDDLDDLPANALAELEYNAIQYTQAATQARLKAPPSSDYGDEFDDEDLDDAVVIDESRSAPAITPALQRNIPGQSTQREQFRQQRYGNHPNLVNRLRPNVPLYQPNRDRLPGPVPGSVDVSQNESMGATQSSQQMVGEDAAALRRQLDEMRRELAAVKQENNAKTGEIAIVRSKLEKQTKEQERERNALQKIGEEKLAKQRKELEAARIAANSAATERDFVKQDLLEAERARKSSKATEKRDLGITTPKKKKAAHRDGFDDDEIEILSPSKMSPSKFKSRMGTPTKAGKRKRKAVDSPLAPLQVISHEESIEEAREAPVFDQAIIERLGIQDDRYDFLGTMLDHRPNREHPRTIEALGRYALPSAPNESFASIILGKIPILGLKKPTTDLPIEFCELFISLWSKCLDEAYYKPIYLLLAMLTTALELKTLAISPYIIDTLLPTAQKTADLIAIPRFQCNPTDPWDKDINISSCLSLLYITALGCMSEPSHIIRFWRLMRFDLVLMILSPNQLTSDFHLMLEILSTSVLRDTFGPIPSPDQMPDFAAPIVDRLTYPLHEVPYLPMSNEKVPEDIIRHLRLEILHLLTGMTRSPFASSAICKHPAALGRLVSLMSDELDTLYDYRSGHASSALILTLSTRLLYHLVTKYEVDMQSKLTTILGGSQKYLLVLSRLNFSEDDLILEGAIGEDVQGLALELLNSWVTPREVDEVNGAFWGVVRG